MGVVLAGGETIEQALDSENACSIPVNIDFMDASAIYIWYYHMYSTMP